jgi:hypothetical protein
MKHPKSATETWLICSILDARFEGGWTPARDAYNGLANFPVSQTFVREHFCNYCATRISTVYHADVRPSRALTMERLADLRSSDVSPGSGQTSQYKRVSRSLSGQTVG